jgi:Clustered mitochondria
MLASHAHFTSTSHPPQSSYNAILLTKILPVTPPTGILFKFAFDACVHRDEESGEEVWMYGMDRPDHELAMKAAGAELLCLVQFLSAVRDSDPVKLTVPLVCLIDYLGFRLYASSLLPISKHTLAFGSADGGKSFHDSHAGLRESVNRACARLHLKNHLAGVQSATLMRTNGPGDLEGT